MSFRQEIVQFLKEMLQIDPEIVEKFEGFVVFDAISVEFPKLFVKGSKTFKNERTSYALHFEANFSAFCFKNSSE